MATNMVRCPSCRGLKRMQGPGGIEKECWTCDGKGKVEAPVAQVEAPVEQVAPVKATKPSTKKGRPKAVKSLEDVVTKDLSEVSAEFPPAELCATPDEVEPVKKKENEAVVADPNCTIFPPYSDNVMKAILEEQTMSLEAWKLKHKYNPELFEVQMIDIGFGQTKENVIDIYGILGRRDIREAYALSRPRAERKVNIAAAQDAAAMTDPAYQKFVKAEEARLARDKLAGKGKIIKAGGM